MKKTTPLSISIGIPAYNEAKNIAHLITMLQNQKIKSGHIQEIIVISDGSTDTSANLVRQIPDTRIKIYEHKQRQGKTETQNELLQRASGKILVICDADVLPSDDHFLEHIISPIVNDPYVGLVGADTTPLPPQTFFEKIICHSHVFKKNIYLRINDRNNIFLCHGRARAFSKKFYKHFAWVNSFSEDAFSYLSCLQKGFIFAFAPKANVFFRSPQFLRDHLKQSRRFRKGKTRMSAYFPRKFVQTQYTIPLYLYIQEGLKQLFFHPVTTTLYVLIFLFVRLTQDKNKKYDSKWETTPSSKQLIV